MKYALAGMVLALVALAGTAAACEGISPGDELNVGSLRCTLAFLLADTTGLYFATAGHCIQEGETASVPGVGPIGVGALHYLVPENGNEQDGAPGDDFGLILIDPEVYDRLQPKMCGWNGPTGIYETTPGSGGVRHYGHGAVFGDLGPTTQTRQGFNLNNNNTAFYWTGAGVPGDSGSGVLHESGAALGVLTHLQVGATSDTNGGTHLLRGFQLAKELKGLDLRLVLMGEDPVAVLAEMRAQSEEPASAETPASTTTPTNGNSTTTTKPPSSQPASNTPPPRNGASDEELAPAADVDDPAKVPGPSLALVALAVAVVALASRSRRA